MIFDYYYANPTGNITLLVVTPVERSKQADIATELMKKEPTAEQVGFLEYSGDKLHLQMAGGEFCGNASMSACAVYCLENGIGDGRTEISVSGTDEPVYADIRMEDNMFFADVTMPKSIEITEKEFNYGNEKISLPVVNLGGISHTVIDFDCDTETIGTHIREWCRETGADAFGVMLLNGSKLTPVVYVPKADTLFFESSCASGTTAVGEYYAFKAGKEIDMTLEEPGGKLRIRACPGKRPVLTGSVSVNRKLMEIPHTLI